MDKRIKRTETEKEVIKTIEARWNVGRKTYGEGISFKQGSSTLHWLDNAIEEAADLLQYLVAAKLQLLDAAEDKK